MKKILTVFLSLCLLASLATCFAFSAHAEESEDIVVTVGQKFEWNSQKGDASKELAWKQNGSSEDGLWKYLIYATVKEVYQKTVYSATVGGFAWNKTPGSTGVGYARVLDFGGTFHPGEAADIVKVFTCPSGGTIDIDTTIARVANVPTGGNYTGTSLAIYLDDQLIYPASGEYLELSNTTERDIPVTNIEVSKNQCIYFHIGAIENQHSDAVTMSNTITYRKVNDNEVEKSTHTGYVPPVITGTYSDPTLIQNNNNGTGSSNQSNNGGLSTGAIIGIVVGAVAVVGIAAAVVVIVKKKKEQ